MAGGRLQKHIPLLSPRQSMRQGLLLSSGGDDSESGGVHPTSGGGVASGVHKNNLGWVLGVVMPTILNALGVAFYLQYPYLVGLYGVLLLIAVLLVCQLTVFFTILSLSAVVTNGRVGGGGCYFLISRAMGPEFGGAIGLVFFCANVVGAAQAQFGVGAAIQPYLPAAVSNNFWVQYGINSACFLVIFVLAILGAEWFTKFAFFLVVAEGVCCAMLFLGMLVAPAVEPYSTYGFEGPSNFLISHAMLPHGSLTGAMFTSTFGLVFSGVTGIMTGANMSGDLRDPAKAIPKGTLIASFSIFGMYLVFIPVIAATFNRAILINPNNQNVMGQTWAGASIPFIAGLIIASLANTLESVVGAARVLQAVARDKVLPLRWFAYGSLKGDEPRVALILVYIMAQLCMMIPSLAQLATFSSIFLLMAYAFVNVTALLLSITGTHNWRPSWRAYSWPVGLIGALLCFAAMFCTNALAAGVAVGVVIVVLLFIRFVMKPKADWGDLSEALLFHQVRKFLLTLRDRQLGSESQHVKFWRPHVLCLASSPERELPLIFVAHALKKGGMFVIGSLDASEAAVNLQRNMTLHDAWDRFVLASKMKALVSVVRGTDPRLGLQNLMLSAGMGSVSVNTVVFGWPEKLCSDDGAHHSTVEQPDMRTRDALGKFPNDITSSISFDADMFLDVLRDADTLGMHIIVGRHLRIVVPQKTRAAVVDVWALQQGDRDASVTTAMLLADGIRRSDNFAKTTRVRLFDVAESEERARELRTLYAEMLEALRFSFEVHVLLASSSHVYATQGRQSMARASSRLGPPPIVEVPEALNEIIARESNASDLVFLAMRLPSASLTGDANLGHDFVRFYNALTHGLPPTLLIKANHSVVLEFQ